MRFFARILPALLVIVLFARILSIPAFAAENTDATSYTMPQTEQGVPRDIHTLSQSVILGMISFVTCALSGIDIATTDHRCLGYNTKTGKLGYVDNSTGIAGMLTNGIAMTYTKPMGTSDYLRYLSGN